MRSPTRRIKWRGQPVNTLRCSFAVASWRLARLSLQSRSEADAPRQHQPCSGSTTMLPIA
jgi:hypothetical protein